KAGYDLVTWLEFSRVLFRSRTVRAGPMPMIEVEGTLLFCRRDGSGTPVVMVHSTACSSSQWDRTSDVLAADHEVICPDLYGHGRDREGVVEGEAGAAGGQRA